MTQFNITLNEEHLHRLFLSSGQDEAFAKLFEEIFNQVWRYCKNGMCLAGVNCQETMTKGFERS